MLAASLIPMRFRFLIHELNHTVLLVDITETGLPTEIFPVEGKSESLPSLRFQSWRAAEQHLLGLSAGQKALDATKTGLKKIGVGVLTIA
jgi:hypothetical protein